MVEMTFEVLLLLLTLIGLFIKHYFLEQFLQFKVQRTGRDFFHIPGSVISHCGSHAAVTTVILFAFWGWSSLIIGALDGLLNFAIKYWRSREDHDKDATSINLLMDSGLETLIFELFYVSIAFLALTTHIGFGS